MDRDTLQDDLDLILEPSRDDESPGEWDWEPPLGTRGAAASSAVEPREIAETGTEASRDGASDPADGPEDEAGDADDDDEEEEEEEEDEEDD